MYLCCVLFILVLQFSIYCRILLFLSIISIIVALMQHATILIPRTSHRKLVQILLPNWYPCMLRIRRNKTHFYHYVQIIPFIACYAFGDGALFRLLQFLWIKFRLDILRKIQPVSAWGDQSYKSTPWAKLEGSACCTAIAKDDICLQWLPW